MTDFFILPTQIPSIINEILMFMTALVLLIACAKLVVSTNLIESLILMSVFSVFISLCYLLMDAPDVSMTEVALGACLSTCVLLNVIKIVGEEDQTPKKFRILLASVLCLIFIGVLSWACLDLPAYGKQDTPLQLHLTQYYIENTRLEIEIPSMVAAILASYRGFDTLGETTVILIAGLAVLLIMSRRVKKGC